MCASPTGPLQHEELRIRPATLHDAAPLATLMTELGYPTSEEDMQARCRVIMTEPHYKIFVADYRREVVGMAGALKSYYFEQNGSYVRLAALVTKEGHRKKGVGKALVQAVEEWAREVDARAVVLNCGNREERTAAHAFYGRLGFEAKSTGYQKRVPGAR